MKKVGIRNNFTSQFVDSGNPFKNDMLRNSENANYYDLVDATPGNNNNSLKIKWK